jgi:GH24 family phage-related lysozyme (muramidase)
VPDNTVDLSEKLVSAIKSAEGLRLTAYRDTAGVWTIGHGHTPSYEGQICTQDQAEAWLRADIAAAGAVVDRLPEARSIDPARFNALSELVFNLGPKKWALFAKTRAAIADKTWQKAHDELLNSKWASQVGSTRSNRIAGLLLTGCYV